MNHPLNDGRKLKSLKRYFRWTAASQLMKGKYVVPYVNDSRLFIGRGLHAANANYYTGLKEFYDMSFVIHFLRETDVFVDVGANVGIYSLLATAVAGAKTYAYEPTPATFKHLVDNLSLNQSLHRTELFNMCVGSIKGNVNFEIVNQSPSTSHVVAVEQQPSDSSANQIPLTTLNISLDADPTCIKIDVEGYEMEVIKGADSILPKPSLKAVIMETNGLADHRFGFKYADLHDIMIDYGFSSYEYDPMNRKLISLDNKSNTTENTLYLRDLDFINHRIQSAPPFSVHGRTI